MPIDNLIDSRIAQYIREMQSDADGCRASQHPDRETCYRCSPWLESLDYLYSLQTERSAERMAA